MNTKDLVSKIESIIEKAAKADKADDAMKFSQAALNAANAMAQIKLNIESKAE